MKIIYFWKPIIWLIVICYLSLMPGNGLPKVQLFNIPHFDKLIHIGFYFIFTLLLIKPVSKLLKYKYLVAGLVAALISGIIEFLQEYVAVLREGDIFDFVANMTGIILAVFFYKLLVNKKYIERFF